MGTLPDTDLMSANNKSGCNILAVVLVIFHRRKNNIYFPTIHSNSSSFRLHDNAVQHMNERILECDANVGEEEVKLQLLTPPGKDLDTVLDQLSALQVS